MLAFCLVLGTLVAGDPVVEHRHVKRNFTSILVFGDSFSDNVRFLSVNNSGSKLSDVPLSMALVIRETEHSCSGTVHGLRTPHILMAGAQMGRSIRNTFQDLLGAHTLLDFAFAGGASLQSSHKR